MIFKSKALSVQNIYPFVVPGLNAIFSLVLLFAFNKDLYTNYVYLTAAISLIYLMLNMGIRLAVVRNSELSENSSVFVYLKNILILYVIFSIVLSYIYSTFKNIDIYFIAVFVFGALNLLLCDVFLAFNNAIGRTKQAYLYFSIIPKSLFIFVYLFCSFIDLSYIVIYFSSVVCSVSAILLIVYIKKAGSDNHSKPASFSLPYRMLGEWGQIALYGLFMPSLIVYAEATQIEMVKSIGIAVMIAQPMSILYQGAVAIKLKELKQLSMSVQSLSNTTDSDIGIYKSLSSIGLVGSVVHASILILCFIFFIEKLQFFNDDSIKVIVIICSTIYINSLFGPNGTLLGLLGKSHYDAFIAFFKLLIVIQVAQNGGDILMLLVAALLSEIFGNVIKNIYVGWRLMTNSLFTLKPLMLSFGIMVVIKYAYF